MCAEDCMRDYGKNELNGEAAYPTHLRWDMIRSQSESKSSFLLEMNNIRYSSMIY